MFLQPLILLTAKTYKETPSWIRSNRTSTLNAFLDRPVNCSWTTHSPLSLTSKNHWVLPVICHIRYPQQLQPADSSTPPIIINQLLAVFWQTASIPSVTPPAKHQYSKSSTPSVPPPAETLSQFYPSSNHQTFLHISQPNAAHPNIYFATKPEWITRTIPNPATECQLMMHPRCNHVLHDQPHFINQPIQQSFTSAEPCKLFQPNTRSPPIVWNCRLFRFRNLMGILSPLLIMIGSTFSKHLFTITDQPHKLTKSAACKTPFPETQKTSFEGTLVTLFSTTFRYRNLSLASVHCNTL